MIADIQSSDSMGALKKILVQRFDKQLDLVFLSDVLRVASSDQDYLESQGNLEIPIFLNQQYFFTARIKQAAQLPTEDKKAISDLVRLTIEPTAYKVYQTQSLAEQKTYFTQPLSVVTNKFYSPQYLTFICSRSEQLKKLADLTHQISDNWAFLQYKDVVDQIESIDDFANLGGVTLFVQDIKSVSHSQLKLVTEALKAKYMHSELPLFVFGSETDLIELYNQKYIDIDQFDILSNQVLNALSLPADNHKQSEIIDFMISPIED